MILFMLLIYNSMSGLKSGFQVVKNSFGITFTPKIYDRVLIWLHGLGSSADEFEDFFFDMNLIDDKVKLILM
jgi:hypothetical protein